MSFAQPRNIQEFIGYRLMPASIVLAIVWAATGGIPTGPETVWDPIPGVPPTPHPLPGEEGYKIPGIEKPPIGEGEEKPTYH